MYSPKRGKYKRSSGKFICNTCDNLRHRFNDEYYSKNNVWYTHINGIKSKVILKDYYLIHDILGCKLLQLLNTKCPNPIIIPMATLLSYCPEYIISENFDCLYRNDDEAVGLYFDRKSKDHNNFDYDDNTDGYVKLDNSSDDVGLNVVNEENMVYLTPSNIEINHLFGFDIVTQKR